MRTCKRNACCAVQGVVASCLRSVASASGSTQLIRVCAAAVLPGCRQDRKLKEGFAMIQKENEQLRRHIGVPAGGGGLSGGSGGGGGGGLAGMAGMAGASGGRNSGRAALGMDGGLGGRPGTALGVRLG
jgi:hypothetical protein